MARKPRIHYPGALYHVMLRGNGGGDIFFEYCRRGPVYRFLFFGPVMRVTNEKCRQQGKGPL